MQNLQPHQQRVVDEKAALGEKIVALTQFICTNEVFKSLDDKNKSLLRDQVQVMHEYFDILDERIALFGEQSC